MRQSTTNTQPEAKVAGAREYLMCPPDHFAVAYTINPWMDPACTVDLTAAQRQWKGLASAYATLGHQVRVIAPEPSLPDMVFAANAALVLDGKVLGARFLHRERAGEAPRYRSWMIADGLQLLGVTQYTFEGEGDVLVVGDTVLAGTGFRTDSRAHAEVARAFGREVVTLRLVDPRFYHLDTALAVLDDCNVAYYPPAFDATSRDLLEKLFPAAVLATEADAMVLGLNAVSDGRHVILPTEATDLAAQLERRGYQPVPVELSEFRKAGGGPKCCTLELRR